MRARMHQWMVWMPAFTALVIPVHPRLSSISLLIWVVSALVFEAICVFSKESSKHSDTSLAALGRSGIWFASGAVGMYLMYGLGLLWTEHWELGKFAMEVKFSLLLVPLLTLHHVHRWGRSGFEKAKNAFLLGLVGFVVWRVSFALWTGDKGAWRYDGLAGPFHPTYIGMYLTLAVLLTTSKKLAMRVMVGLAGGFVGLLASKAAWIVALGVWGVEALRSRKGDVYRTWTLLGSIGLLITCGTLADEGRSDELRKYVSHGANLEQTEPSMSTPYSDASIPEVKTGSSGGRMQAWKASVALIRRHVMGVGTGDVTDELCSEYGHMGATYALKKQMNPHSVWLQMGVSHGVFGLLLLLAWIGGTTAIAWHSGQWTLVLWLGIWVVNGCFESLLELQQGVVPTVFLTLMLAVMSSPDRASTEH